MQAFDESGKCKAEHFSEGSLWKRRCWLKGTFLHPREPHSNCAELLSGAAISIFNIAKSCDSQNHCVCVCVCTCTYLLIVVIGCK